MGTRGALCLVVNDQEKTIYNHFDSYPAGLGRTVLEWLRKELEHEWALAEKVRSLRPVPNTDPTANDLTRLWEFHDAQVSTGTDWYSVLRRTQGDPAAILKAGLYEPADDFPLDSLFCEWAYVVDVTERQFEVYKGFQKNPSRVAGRWAELPGLNGYAPVTLVDGWSFDGLPDDDEFLQVNDR